MSKGTYYRRDTETPVAYRDALAVWAPVAHDILVRTAHTYQSWITDQQLAVEVQQETGIIATVVHQKWVEPLLDRVAAEAQARSEPMVTALCVDMAQRVAAGYPAAVAAREGAAPEDPQQHAAEQRLLCYRRWAEDLPADKGVAALTPRVEKHRTRDSRPAPRGADAEAEAVCPTCFTVMPQSRICSYC